MNSKATVIDADGVRGRLLTAMPVAARAGTVAIALEDGRHVVAPHERLVVDRDGTAYELDGRFSEFEIIDPGGPVRAPEADGSSSPSSRRSTDPSSDPSANGANQTELTDAKTMTLAHEEVEVSRQKRPIGRVRLDKRVETEEVVVEDQVEVEELDIERVPVGEVIDEPPEVRREGDTLVIPVVEERLVKQLVLVEEVHVHRRRRTEEVDVPVTLRRERVDISRERLDSRTEHGEDRPSR